MTQYIDKDALVAEINKRIIDAPVNNIGHQRVWAYNDVKDIIGTLEVKEVDFVKEFYTFSEKHKLMDKGIEFADIEKTASFFFQLGLKAAQNEHKSCTTDE